MRSQLIARNYSDADYSSETHGVHTLVLKQGANAQTSRRDEMVRDPRRDRAETVSRPRRRDRDHIPDVICGQLRDSLEKDASNNCGCVRLAKQIF